MVNEDQSIFITNLLLELEPTNGKGSPFAPAVHAGMVQVSAPAFRHIVATLLRDEIDIPAGRLAFVDCGWRPGGAWITMRIRSFIQQTVTVKTALAPAPDGRLLVDVLDVRAGILPLNRLLDPILDQIVARPGFSRSGATTFEIDIAELLLAGNVPINWTARVLSVNADDRMLVLELGQP